MYATLLLPFQPAAHRHILVEDPDGLLDDETARAELLGRGYRLLGDSDPVRLRHAAGPPPDAPPTIILTPGPVNELPYDWWAVAHHLTLRLTDLYPSLNATVLRELTGTEQRRRLAAAALPAARLGREATADALLRAVFDADPATLTGPAALVGWLARYHHDLPGPLPPALRARLLGWLAAAPAFAGWPLDELLDDRQAFGRFAAAEWDGYLAAATGQPLGEGQPAYHLDFAADATLQDTLPLLLRRGVLSRSVVREPASLPQWARAAVRAPDEDDRRRRAADLLARLDEQAAALVAQPGNGRWAEWAAVARTWADLTGLALDLRDAALEEPTQQWSRRLDPAFAAWLEKSYAVLAAQKLPQPHHVHHAPHLLAYERRQRGADGRVALLVLDGLSLADWGRVRDAWAARRPGWTFADRGPLLAQIPTVTAVSRQALVSGLRPAEFAKSLGNNASEAKLWAAFWGREGLSGASVAYGHLRPGEAFTPDRRVMAQCLIETSLDDRLHGATQGAAEAWASLGVWLEGRGRAVEEAIDALLAAGYAVYVASDHGHTEAWGMGQPREGETAESRGKRSRLYRARETAEMQHSKYPQTRLWHSDGLLPEHLVALLPDDGGSRVAFAPEYNRVVTHGGLTLDEVVVPFARVTAQS